MSRGPSAVGLDIGTTALRAVELAEGKKGKFTVLRFHEMPIPAGAVSKGEILLPEIVIPALKKLWSEGGFRSKKVVLGAGNQRTLVRDLSVPKGSSQQMKESLHFHVQSALQIPIEGSLLDFYPVSEGQGEHDGLIHGLLVSTEKAPILENIRIVERAGLSPIDVDLIPFVLNRLLVFHPHVLGTVALLEVGANSSSIVVAIDAVPHFVRIIPTGGDDLTLALQTGLGVTEEKANRLKRTLRVGIDTATKEAEAAISSQCTCAKCMSDLETVDDPRVQEILRVCVTELLVSVRNTISYFNNTRPEEQIMEILICGGGSQLPGFAEALSEVVQLPVHEADPFALVTPSRRVNLRKWQESSNAYSVALGLAMPALSA